MPVFPLPDTVLFPHTILPLHIFEDRYCEMVRDASSGEGLIAMTLLRQGWESDYQGQPDINSIGTLGRIEDLEALPNGHFDLRLAGLQRMRYVEIQTETAYRKVQVEAIPEQPVDEDDPEVQRAKLDLIASHGYLLREIAGDLQPSIVFDDRVEFSAAVNRLCAALPIDATIRQDLLETNDMLARHHEVSILSQQILEYLLRLKIGSAQSEHLLN